MSLATKVNRSSTVPAAPSGKKNLVLQQDGGAPTVNESGYVPNTTGSIATKVANYTAVQADGGKFLPCSGTFSVKLDTHNSPIVPNVDSDWEIYIVNTGSGTVTVDGNGVTITGTSSAGVSSFTLAAGASALIRVSSDSASFVAFLGAGGSSGSVPTTRLISTTAPLTGGGDLSADRTLVISNFTGDSGAGGAKGAVPAPSAGDNAAGKFLKAGGGWAVPAGTSSGTVTSVAMTGDGVVFNSTVSGSPVTTSGTLAPALLTQTANKVFAGPASGSAAAPTFRSLTQADLPAAVIGSSLIGKPTIAQVVALIGVPYACVIPAAFGSLSGCSVGANPTASAVYTVYKNNVSIGTITISTGGVFTGSTGSPSVTVSLALGDRITITAPSPVDSTLSDVILQFTATRS